MFLTLDETAVNPPGLQLFDHIVIGVRLLPYGLSNNSTSRPESKLFAEVTLGTVVRPKAVTLVTQSFGLMDIPDHDRVYQRWSWLRKNSKGKYLDSYYEALLKCLRQFHQLQVEFRVNESDVMDWFVVHLGILSARGRLSAQFDIINYFGESTKLTDPT